MVPTAGFDRPAMMIFVRLRVFVLTFLPFFVTVFVVVVNVRNVCLAFGLTMPTAGGDAVDELEGHGDLGARRALLVDDDEAGRGVALGGERVLDERLRRGRRPCRR